MRWTARQANGVNRFRISTRGTIESRAATADSVGDTFLLPDGRQLTYAVFGDAGGLPVLFFHGSPGSRLGPKSVASAAIDSGARLIGVDRPGMGRSDPHPGRRLTDWPDDVARMLDHLDLGQVAVAGVSAGAAYVYACCTAMPDRMLAAAVVSGVGPPWALRGMRPASMRFVMARLPRLGQAMFSSIADRARRNPAHFVPPGSSRADLRALERPGVREAYVAALLKAYRSGVEGVMEDQRLQLFDWGIDLGSIATPVHLWHGDDDRVVSPSVARRVAGALPSATLTVLPDAGHFSTLTEHAAEILDDLVGTARERAPSGS